jgi:WD40 repeat protein
LTELDESLAMGNFPVTPEQDTERAVNGFYTGLELSADGHFVAVQIGGFDCAVEVWSLRPHARVMAVSEGGLLALSPNADRLLLAGGDGGYTLWSVSEGRRLKAPKVADEACDLAAWAPDGERYVLAHGGAVSVVGGMTTVELAEHRARVLALAFSPCGELVASAAQDGSLRVWDTRSGVELRRFDLRGVSATAVCFSPDGQSLFSGSSDGLIRTWRLWTVEELQQMAQKRGTVLSERNCRRFGLST